MHQVAYSTKGVSLLYAFERTGTVLLLTVEYGNVLVADGQEWQARQDYHNNRHHRCFPKRLHRTVDKLEGGEVMKFIPHATMLIGTNAFFGVPPLDRYQHGVEPNDTLDGNDCMHTKNPRSGATYCAYA